MNDAGEIYRSALALYRRKEFTRAAEAAGRALKSDPSLVNGWRLLADSCAAMGQLDRGIDCLLQAQQYAGPQYSKRVSVGLHLSEMLIRAGRQGEARRQLQQLSLGGVEHIQPLSQAAYLCSLCGAHRESRALFERALILAPDNPQLLFNYAAANRAMGDLAEAELLYDRLIALRPNDFEAYKNRSDLRRQTSQSNHIAELERLSAQPDLSASDASQLNFSLAKELEDLCEYSRSFAALEKACRLRRDGIRYSLEPDLQRLAEIESCYSGEFMRGYRESHGVPLCQDRDTRGEGVIFILGMPRTGTTLVDRILCAADEVFSAGEPGIFARELTGLVQSANVRADTPGDFVRYSREIDFVELGHRYQTELRSRPGTVQARVIIDKNPMNFLYVGLIRLALPKARIVHLRRNAMDTCYAILKAQFRNAYPFSYNQWELGEYYLAYRRLMDHWSRLLPEVVHELHYEKLVEDLEGESRRLFDFCGLEWTGSVLDFYRQAKQGTATASAAQVRQPVYTSSIGKWKHYREQLQPLQEILQTGGIEIE